MDKGISGRKPVGHLLGETLDPNPGRIAVGSFEAMSQALVAATQADDEADFRELECDLNRDVDLSDSPTAARNEDDLSVDRQTERGTRIVLPARRTEGRVRKAVDAMRPSRSTGDPAQFLDRFAVCDKVDVGPRGRPVPKGGKVGHCSTQGNAQAAADTQPAEDFGRMRVGGDHDIRPMGLDQAQKPAPADPRQGGLRQATGGREDGENPKPDIPQPAETEENDSRGALADRDDCPPHRRQSIDRLDLDVRPFSAQLCRKGASRKVVTLPDARGHDHDPWRHRRSSLRR